VENEHNVENVLVFNINSLLFKMPETLLKDFSKQSYRTKYLRTIAKY
jgi:hypothetical protein